MPPVISIVGKSKSGKTTLIERLVAELKRRGYRVATIKHSPKGFELDQPGKDSWRHAQSGSDAVVVSSRQRLAMILPQDHDATIEE
ncbi:MAG: molybdopterin-guanine dinucleotide biosynthesis protein B, partial [Dehalococcoidia bacterium]|nr:molybdopterin-guanine dinucleotide biosynthesis protein B [Dehalococcoidia bacterium]